MMKVSTSLDLQLLPLFSPQQASRWLLTSFMDISVYFPVFWILLFSPILKMKTWLYQELTVTKTDAEEPQSMFWEKVILDV